MQQAHRQERNYNRARLEGYNPGYNPSVKWPITRNDAKRIGRRQKKKTGVHADSPKIHQLTSEKIAGLNKIKKYTSCINENRTTSKHNTQKPAELARNFVAAALNKKFQAKFKSQLPTGRQLPQTDAGAARSEQRRCF